MEFVARLMRIPKQEKLPVWYGAVDRDGYHYQMENIHLRDFNRRDGIAPFRIAFEHCMNRIDGFMHAIFPKEHVLWIHDGGSLNEHAKGTLRSLRSLIKEMRADAAEFPPGHPLHYQPPMPEDTLSTIADMIYFGNDEESRLLQLADVCCSTIMRALRSDTTVAPYYELLRSQVLNDGTKPAYCDARKTVQQLRKILAERRTKLKRST